ncbi:pirin family protein [Sphingobacterium hungaricum]
MATYVYHEAGTRGIVNHGWLHSKHSFSFGSYYNPERMNFGALRVLNDDQVAAGAGFGKHPHDNMEIISIPLSGGLAHQDSMGNGSTIEKGNIQVMSAGTGIQHAEFNASQTEEVRFLQIWVIPNQRNVTPRYDEKRIFWSKAKNDFLPIVSPEKKDSIVWIYQDAYFYLGDFDAGFEKEYKLQNPEHGVYLFVLSGSVEVDGQVLNSRDALTISDTDAFTIKATSNAEFLLMEVPLN